MARDTSMTTQLPSEDAIRDALRQVIDPEVNLNIVDLGLVYAIAVSREEIRITMTMTTPACPVGPLISGQAEAVVQALAPAGTAVAVDLVWEPPWQPEMMSEMARVALGWSG